MYSVSADFLEALDRNAVQHIRGTLTTVSGLEISLDESVLVDVPTFEKQMTANQDVFNFGEIYVGSAEITVVLANISLDEIKGGEFTLESGVELLSGSIEWIPLGVWDIVSADRKSAEILAIKGYDHMNRLNVATNVDVVSVCTLSAAMSLVTQRTGVEFAQTAEELTSSLWSGEPDYSSTFANTCLDEVRMISQYLGGFAYADRLGRIYIKRLSKGNDSRPEIVLNIPASRRFSAKISECQYRVGSVSYTDAFGQTVSRSRSVRIKTTLGFSDNRYFWETDDLIQASRTYGRSLERIIDHLTSFLWYPGTVEYYGNPALDPGDMVTIEDGVAGSQNRINFLITAILWKFRGPQTLISAGAPENGAAVSGSSSSGSVTTSVTVITSKNIEKVDLKIFPGELAGGSVLLAGGGFSVRSQTRTFAEFSLVLKGTQDSVFTGEIYIDDELFYPVIKQNLREDEYSFIRITVPFDAPASTHKIELYASGYAVPEDCSAYVWGQNITAESPQLTDESDYTYTVKDYQTTVTGYTGSVLYPRIPEYLGGYPVKVIGKGAFTDTAVTAVYIPDGTTEIS